ncbi:Ribonuclease H domain [Dillenia turbinata]|uniref:Ribonuclease H domain n=1 Tax=Dillenia turbinata TaxID=194707 RepID=A0AAN8W4U9_9MAGN
MRGKSLGECVAGFYSNIGKSEVLQAEIWGLREGLFMTKKQWFYITEVKCHSEVLVKLLKEDMSDDHPLACIIQDCKNVMRDLRVQQVNHVYREANVCVDHMATRGKGAAMS